MSKDEFLKEEKDCADMLGLTVEEYRKSAKKVKVSSKEQETGYIFDNTLLQQMGFDENILKKSK